MPKTQLQYSFEEKKKMFAVKGIYSFPSLSHSFLFVSDVNKDDESANNFMYLTPNNSLCHFNLLLFIMTKSTLELQTFFYLLF